MEEQKDGFFETDVPSLAEDNVKRLALLKKLKDLEEEINANFSKEDSLEESEGQEMSKRLLKG